MNINTFRKALLPLAISLVLGPTAVSAAVQVQCKGDVDGDAQPDPLVCTKYHPNNGSCQKWGDNPDYDPNVTCMHLSAGDGYATMGDGTDRYIFSFADVTGLPTSTTEREGRLDPGGHTGPRMAGAYHRA